MKAIFKTKSNYNNSNNVVLNVVEIVNSRISVEMPQHGFNEKGEPKLNDTIVIADFNCKELITFVGNQTF